MPAQSLGAHKGNSSISDSPALGHEATLVLLASEVRIDIDTVDVGNDANAQPGILQKYIDAAWISFKALLGQHCHYYSPEICSLDIAAEDQAMADRREKVGI